jgi:hypothetical protein
MNNTWTKSCTKSGSKWLLHIGKAQYNLLVEIKLFAVLLLLGRWVVLMSSTEHRNNNHRYGGR